MSVPLPLRSALGPCLAVPSARAGKSFLLTQSGTFYFFGVSVYRTHMITRAVR